MVGSKRSTRIAARKSGSRPITTNNDAQSDTDTGADEDKKGSTLCDDDEDSASSNVGGNSESLEPASDHHLSLPPAEGIESNKRRWKKLEAPQQRRRSSETHFNIIKVGSAMKKGTSLTGKIEQQDLQEKLYGSRKRMPSEANISGGSKRSKLPISDDSTSETIAHDTMIGESIDSDESHKLLTSVTDSSTIVSDSLGAKVDSSKLNNRYVDDGGRDRSPPNPQHDDSKIYDKDIKNGTTLKRPESNAAKTETEELISISDHSIVHPCAPASNNGESLDKGNPCALAGSGSLTCRGNFDTDNVEAVLKKQSPEKGDHDIIQNNNDDNGTSRDNILRETVASRGATSTDTDSSCLAGEHSRVNDMNPELNSNNILTPRGSTDRPRIRKAPSVSQLKMALFLEASKAHSCGNDAIRIFANYWDTLGKYLAFDPHGSMKRVRPEFRSRAGIESILSGFLTTKRMKILHNKLILSIMAEAMKTHAPAHYSSHVPHQWKPKTIPSLCAQVVDDTEIDCYDQSAVLPLWNSHFGYSSGTWTACGGEVTLSKTDCSNSIDPKVVGSIHSGDLATESMFPSCRLPGALYIDPLVRKLTSRSGVKVSDNAVWMIIVAVREYLSSILKKIIANDEYFGSGHTPHLPNHFRISLACQHNPSTTNNLRDRERIQQERSDQGEPAETMELRVINSTSLSNVLAESLSAASRLTLMYTAVSSNDLRGTSSLSDLEMVKRLVNGSIQKAASRRYKSSPEYEAKLSTSRTTNNSNRATPIHTNNNPIIQPDEKPALVVPLPATAQSIPTSFPPSVLYRNQPQHVSLPIDPQYPAMPFLRAQSSNRSDSKLNSVDQNQLALRQLLPTLRPNRDPPPPPPRPPQLLTNLKETLLSSSSSSSLPTTTPVNAPAASRRESKNLATMITRGENGDGTTTLEEKGKDDGKDITTTPPAVSNNIPTTPQSRGYGVKNLAAIKSRASSASSTETGK